MRTQRLSPTSAVPKSTVHSFSHPYVCSAQGLSVLAWTECQRQTRDNMSHLTGPLSPGSRRQLHCDKGPPGCECAGPLAWPACGMRQALFPARPWRDGQGPVCLSVGELCSPQGGTGCARYTLRCPPRAPQIQRSQGGWVPRKQRPMSSVTVGTTNSSLCNTTQHPRLCGEMCFP